MYAFYFTVSAVVNFAFVVSAFFTFFAFFNGKKSMRAAILTIIIILVSWIPQLNSIESAVILGAFLGIVAVSVWYFLTPPHQRQALIEKL
jgi:hypothetical protein